MLQRVERNGITRLKNSEIKKRDSLWGKET